MLDESKLRNLMDKTVMPLVPDDAVYTRVTRAVRWRRWVATASLAAVIAIVIGVATTWPATRSEQILVDSGGSAISPAGGRRMPNVVDLGEGDALKLLARAGLEATVVYERRRDVSAGLVTKSLPPSGTRLSGKRLVIFVASPPQQAPDVDDGSLSALGRLIEREPAVFLGAYRKRSGSLHVAFNPGVDMAAWFDDIEDAVGGEDYEVTSCVKSGVQLEGIQRELGNRGWDVDPSAAFSAWVDPSSCSVKLQSDQLSDEDVWRLAQMFGRLVTIDTSGGAYLYG